MAIRAARTRPGRVAGPSVTIRHRLQAVLVAQGFGLGAAGGRLVREAGGGGLAPQRGDDAPAVREVVAAGGAGPPAVGAVGRRPARLRPGSSGCSKPALTDPP